MIKYSTFMHIFHFCFLKFKILPLYLDITSIRVLRRNFRNSSLFSVACKNFPSPRRVSAANLICQCVSILRKPFTSLNRFCTNLRRSLINLLMFFFSEFRMFLQYLIYIAVLLSLYVCAPF